MKIKKLTKISSVSVVDLFGLYDYELKMNEDDEKGDEKISIFYGDNGCGKSTLLRLAFHMLAPNRNMGHKKYLMDVEFKSVSVKFNDGSIVSVMRKETGDGPYAIRVKRPGKKRLEAMVVSPKADDPRNVDLHEVIEPQLADLDCSLYLLSDDRAIQRAGGEFLDEGFLRRMQIRSKRFAYDDHERRMLEGAISENPEDIAKRLLLESIENAEEWFRRRVIGSSSRGDSGVNEIYRQILTRISSSGGDSLEDVYFEESVISKISSLERQSKNFSKYGLLAEFDGRSFVQVLKGADKKTKNLIIDVMAPYLDSMETKHNAMSEIYERIDTFVDVANNFYTNKTISYDLKKGIQIRDSSDRLLEPSMLSSGERHLLLLFCTSIVAGGAPSILMIDEPEISLNIKWQRMLIDALIKCIGENDIQFIFSTHSFEILSKHKNRVVKLENGKG